ncbi:lasso peptide biosynthesis B2 protein [Streptomyces millisiae]|uniref:Lasso peptide biosynthesis B2 protein n=1 Tax=Streptomyces millisiae TaxID=3075542 RepID=A0ABU2LW94_9ACTN|nr:lasso peptide biosynthesis B2 protein [Streptomyces sp. DSM 44918]MDT0321866.1 lasso peptide biosynthesis B2 protein [Streptomyces sp. DSM 44918]
MSHPVALPPTICLTRRQRLRARAAAIVAAQITSSTPRMNATLTRLLRHARPSTAVETRHAHAAVTTATLRLGGTTACLNRSVAALLYCRGYGHAPTLVIGIRPGTSQVHAWLEADGHPIAEPFDPRHLYQPVSLHTPRQEMT